MTKATKMNWPILMLTAALCGQAADRRSEFVTGRAYYSECEFRKAAAHFQLALKTDPNDAECYYWTGMSYQVLADIAMPLDRKYTAKARANLTKAVELAPNRPEYRRELFEFLLNSTPTSRRALRQAADMLSMISKSDPDYGYMRRSLDNESREVSSVGARLGRLLLGGAQAAYRIAELPASALSGRTTATPSPASRR